MKDPAKTVTDIVTRRKVYSIMHMQSVHFTTLSFYQPSANLYVHTKKMLDTIYHFADI